MQVKYPAIAFVMAVTFVFVFATAAHGSGTESGASGQMPIWIVAAVSLAGAASSFLQPFFKNLKTNAETYSALQGTLVEQLQAGCDRLTAENERLLEKIRILEGKVEERDRKIADLGFQRIVAEQQSPLLDAKAEQILDAAIETGLEPL